MIFRITILLSLIFFLSFSVVAQDLPPADTSTFHPSYLIGTGVGFKPYMTPIKAGGSAPFTFGYRIAPNSYLLTDLDVRTTDAQLKLGYGRVLVSSGNSALMLRGDAGFGVNSDNAGFAMATGGTYFYDVSKRLRTDSTYIAVSVGVTKTTVPAPVQDSITVSPVQPEFRLQVFKSF